VKRWNLIGTVGLKLRCQNVRVGNHAALTPFLESTVCDMVFVQSRLPYNLITCIALLTIGQAPGNSLL
jgi:hypothetical protein